MNLKTHGPVTETTDKKNSIDNEMIESIIMTVLLALNGLFLLFTFVQFSYLFSAGNVSVDGAYTYSQYARKGFFELTVISLLNSGIIMIMMKFSNKLKSNWSNALTIEIQSKTQPPENQIDNLIPNANFSYTPKQPNIQDTVQFTDKSTEKDGNIIR